MWAFFMLGFAFFSNFQKRKEGGRKAEREGGKEEKEGRREGG
jgi:hypothetical protein